VVAYGPDGVDRLPRPTLEVEPESLLGELELPLLTPIAMVRAALPGMLERGDGAFPFTQGISARQPVPALASVSIGMAGFTSYLHTLHTELAPRGIFAGTMLIDGMIDRSRDMYTRRDRVEEIVA
jgi:NAD(P)-dependent dehydrogenase (short-subunit alcohol dehydrogenase family)